MSRWCQDAAVSAAPRRLSVYSAVCGAGRAGVVTASAGHPGCSPRPDLRATERRHRPHPQHWHGLTAALVISIPFLLSLRSVSAFRHDQQIRHCCITWAHKPEWPYWELLAYDCLINWTKWFINNEEMLWAASFHKSSHTHINISK